MHLSSRLSILLLIATGCSSDKGAPTDTAGSANDASEPPTQSDEPPPDAPTEEVDIEPLFEVTGGPYDLALSPDGRLFISIEESRIDVWDPETEWVEEHTDRAGSVFGIHWYEEHLYYTTSNHRQSGALMRLDGRDGTLLASASGSTVFREPSDLALAPDGRWVIPDPTVGTLFVSSTDGSRVDMIDCGVEEPSTVAADDAFVYVGGTNGVVRIPWPDGTPESIDSRTVSGLHMHGSRLLAAGPEWGVFEVGTETRLGADEIRLAGRMVGDDTLFVADWGGAAVWAVTP